MTSILDGTERRPDATTARRRVPWGTVLPLAVLTAYVDGFWMTSLRGAVGAIERTQSPFAGWWRESTLSLPVFVLAVLGAFTLALHWFGPVLRLRTIAATALLVVAATTLVGTAEVAVSSAYDYHLQSQQLQMMDSMRGSCVADSCLADMRQASLTLQVRAVLSGGGLILVSNLVAVGWAIAMLGGRLDVSKTRKGVLSGTQGSTPRARVDDLRVYLAAGLAGGAAVHAAVVPEHLTEWAAAGVFFIALAAAELAVGWLVVLRPQPPAVLAAVVVSVGPLLLWVWSRTVGMPFGPEPGIPEQVGLPDLSACALEVGTLLVAWVIHRRGARRQRPASSDHSRWLVLVSVVAVAAIGAVGSNLAWFDGSTGSLDETVMGSH